MAHSVFLGLEWVNWWIVTGEMVRLVQWCPHIGNNQNLSPVVIEKVGKDLYLQV